MEQPAVLRGNAPAKIDDKGRLKVPNGFRALVQQSYGREVFVTSLTGESVRIYAEAFQRDADFYGFYRSLQAYRESLSDSGTTLLLAPDSEFFRYFGGTGGTGPK